MARPFLLVQLSDPHIGATWADGDPVAGLRAAVESVRRLPGAPDRVTLIALHHPPVSTGIAAWDELGLPATDRRALGAVLDRHPQVRRVVAGHMHRTMTAELAGRAVLVVPSTYIQTRLNFNPQEIETVADPPGFAVHALLDGELASHVQPVA